MADGGGDGETDGRREGGVLAAVKPWCTQPHGGASRLPPRNPSWYRGGWENYRGGLSQLETGEDRHTGGCWRVYRHVLFGARRHAGGRVRTGSTSSNGATMLSPPDVRGTDSSSESCSESTQERVRV